MKAPIRIIALTFALLACMAASAQTTYTVGTYPCGPAGEPLQCNGFPVSLMGSAVGTGWLHDYLVGTGPDYIVWQDGMELMPEAIITKSSCLATSRFVSGTRSAVECVSLAVEFKGGSLTDNTYYTGSGSFAFTYFWYAGGGGRGGGGAGWRRTLTGGSVMFVTY
jgi:hypothetical protein